MDQCFIDTVKYIYSNRTLTDSNYSRTSAQNKLITTIMTDFSAKTFL